MAIAAMLMPRETFALHFMPEHIDRLAACCDLVSREPFANVRALSDERRDVDIIVTGWGSPNLGDDFLDILPEAKLVAHSAGTLKSIVNPGLLDLGLRVTTAAEVNARPVAEFSLSWILRWNKRLDQFQRDYARQRSGFRMNSRPNAGAGNCRNVIGIVSASHVGRALLGILRPFDFDCIIYDPFLSDDEAAGLGARKVALGELLATADVVSLNAPLLAETEKMIGAAEFAAMKDGALFLNTARGGIVDHAAMAAALAGGRISAVLDVTDPEPLPSDSPFWEMPNVWLTPHVAGSLGPEIHRMTDWCLSEVERFVRGEVLRSEIGVDAWERAA